MPQSTSATIYAQYVESFESLKDVVIKTEQRILADEPDPLFIENVNFFVKSYLISLCSYLEAYLQDIAFKHAETISNKIAEAQVPHNFLHWRLNTGLKENKQNFNHISLPLTKKEISGEISANPHKTLKLFKLLGVDLTKKDDFENTKSLIYAIVSKRNKIIHHNDTAADISLGDLKSYIEIVIPYMSSVKEAVDEVAA